MLLAARLDYHNVMDDVTFSPRAALVYKPVPSHTVRATYNHAFQTPTANQFFTDILGVRDLFEGQRLEPLLGFAPTTDLRAQGVPGGGFSFRRDPFGAPMFRSPYARLGGLSESDYIGLNDESFTNVMWSVARDASVAGLGVGFVDQGLLTSEEAEAVSGALATVLPLQVEGVTNALFKLDLEREGFVPVNDVESIEPLRVSRTQTYELGYKGVLGDRVFFGIDVYHTRVRDFFGPFAVATPNVFLDGTTLQSELYNDLQVALSDPENAEAAEALAVFDTMPGIGNGNGSAADEVSFLVGRALAAAIPFGTVSPEQAFDETAVLLTRQNFGNISLNGLDFNVMYHVTRRWALGGTFSWVSDNYFDHNELGDDDPTQAVSLNAPRQKYSASVRYTDPGLGFAAELRGRYVGEFPVRSDVYIGTVDAYTVVDLSVDYRVPFSPNTRLTLTVQNVLDNEHKEFVDVPDLGRLGLLRISHAF